MKEHRNAYTSLMPICSKTCTFIPIFHSERWSFDVYASAKDNGWVSVSKSVYDRYSVGDFWKADKR